MDPASPSDETTPALAIGVCASVLCAGLLAQLALVRAAPRAAQFSALFWYVVGLVLVGALELLPSAFKRVITLLDADFSGFFFTVLLPPIVFHSGCALASGEDGLSLADARAGAAPALALAVGGTVVAAVVTFALLLAAGAAGAVSPALPPLAAGFLAVAASATDAVAAVSVLRTARAPPLLYAAALGESILNDAVTIVMGRALETLGAGGGGSAAAAAGAAVGDLAWGALGSTGAGLGVGAGVALVLKHGRLGARLGAAGVEGERAVLALAPVLSFFAAEAAGASGVVSALVSGVVVAAVALRNAAPPAAAFARALYATVASLAEHLTLVFLGVASAELVTGAFARAAPAALALAAAAAIARAAAVGAALAAVNRCGRRAAAGGAAPPPPAQRLSFQAGAVLWFAGPRGGVAYALADRAASGALSRDADAGDALRLAALFLVVVTLPTVSLALPAVLRAAGFEPAAAAPLQGGGGGGGGGDAARPQLAPPPPPLQPPSRFDALLARAVACLLLEPAAETGAPAESAGAGQRAAGAAAGTEAHASDSSARADAGGVNVVRVAAAAGAAEGGAAEAEGAALLSRGGGVGGAGGDAEARGGSRG